MILNINNTFSLKFDTRHLKTNSQLSGKNADNNELKLNTSAIHILIKNTIKNTSQSTYNLLYRK